MAASTTLPKPEPASGMAGVIAGTTNISSVGTEGHGLQYRGYSIIDLANNCIFEQVAYLLMFGDLPTDSQLNSFQNVVNQSRVIPDSLKSIIELIPSSAHPMDVLRTACSMLGTLFPEQQDASSGLYQLSSGNHATQIATTLISVFSAVLCYWHHFHQSGVRIDTSGLSQTESLAHYLLRLLHQSNPTKAAVRAVNVSLILYAEHGFAASTFACRVTASTKSDIYSCICTGIGTLRGALHGGANEAAMHLIEQFATPDQAVQGVKEMLRTKKLIMGFGHRVYKKGDPRSDVIKSCSEELASLPGGNPNLVEISKAIEKLMWDEKRLFCNLDFFSASAYNQCGIPTSLFTPIFVLARTAGWVAHVNEERVSGKLIRPDAAYTGVSARKFPSKL
uniref:Citrate synthase n=1 Tax=Spongospora subterranea TaxID=70186 RepID=A0A0H5QWB2_9EUKA|eukprot:CRZ06273.1 hypothetical protein [Spongospora subterranea]